MSRILVFLLSLAVATCAPMSQRSAPADKPKAQLGTWGVELAHMDTNVRPGDDFFRYVNGRWLDETEIPADRPITGSFYDLRNLSEDRLIAIISDLGLRQEVSEEERKVRDFYRAYMDTDAIEAAGLAPAQGDLDYLAGLATHEDVARAMGRYDLLLGGPLRGRVEIDDGNPNAYILAFRQSGLGLPDRDYYLLDEKGIAATREAYRDYLRVMLELVGAENAKARAEKVFQLETAIAGTHWPRADRRDADKTYNIMTLSELEAFAPEFPWRAHLEALGLPEAPDGDRRMIIGEKSGFPPAAKLFAETPVAVWRDYLLVRYLHANAAFLPKRFDDADFAFYGKVLAGQEQQLPRSKRAVNLVDQALGEAVGKIYVARYFPPEAKAKALELVRNLLRAYEKRIKALDWMSDATKKRALAKLATFTVKIGYPEEWRDYSALDIRPGDALGNVHRAALYDWRYDVDRIDGPVDRGEWGMRPQTVNAYYNPGLNEIVFPAAILQPPFFDPYADDAVNYGGIGAVIGHEIGHGFDDQGSKYDADGTLRNWWTDEDRARFEERTAGLVEQYSAYSPLEGLHINGRLTLGENIGDLGGVAVSYEAYRMSLKGKEPPVLDGFTGDQRFFLAFGQVWRTKARDGVVRQRVLSDPHSAPQFRAIGPVRNVDAWYAAFGVTEGDKYYLPPEKRVSIW